MAGKSRIAAPTTCCDDEQKARCTEVTRRLEANYGEPKPALHFSNAFELLIAVILSAQTTDDGVNRVTPILFTRYPDAASLAAADPLEVEEIIRPTGFFHQKTKSIMATAQALVAEHGGEVPASMDELVALRGVARKTANIVLGSAFGIVEGIAVDTHVLRLAQRLAFSANTDPNKVEGDLCSCFEQEHWYRVNYDLISHGRAICTAKRPACGACFLSDICPSAFEIAGWRQEV
jgi:endonuclease III